MGQKIERVQQAPDTGEDVDMESKYPSNIPAELRESWALHERHGDIAKITQLGYSYPVIHRAVRHGYAKQGELPGVITKFFMDRAEKELKDAQALHTLHQEKKDVDNARKRRKSK